MEMEHMFRKKQVTHYLFALFHANFLQTGNTGELGAEIQANFNNSFSFTFGSTFYVQYAAGEHLNAILVDGNHPYISTAAKAEPSPDWFSGFYNFSTIDSATNQFYQTFSINTFPWDAGVDGGVTYKARPDPLTVPRPITVFTYTTTPSGVFITADKTVVTVASWTCELVLQKEDIYGDKIYVNVTGSGGGSASGASRQSVIFGILTFILSLACMTASW
jgi:hypothetical protein